MSEDCLYLNVWTPARSAGENEVFFTDRLVHALLIDGTTGQGRGFVLLQSAAPHGRTITPRALANYQAMIRLVNQ